MAWERADVGFADARIWLRSGMKGQLCGMTGRKKDPGRVDVVVALVERPVVGGRRGGRCIGRRVASRCIAGPGVVR